MVLNAYLGPVMARYIERLARGSTALGLAADAASHAIERRRHRLRHGGGDAGAHGAVGPVDRRGRRAGDRPRWPGFADLITFDMGGTSTDVALLQDGQCKLASEATVHGYPIKAPMLDIHTVGAGGGSIAYIDAGGLLKVGPRCAGADPGPVCYDQRQSRADRHRRQRGAADAEPRRTCWAAA